MKSFYRLCVVLTALSCCLNLALAQNETEWMPDENLRTIVREALDLDSNSALTQQAMQALTILNAGNGGITDLTGLQHATRLEELDLSANNIRSIVPLEDLTRLTALNLNFNSIQVITSLEELTNLTRLSLRSNDIE